MTDRRRNLVILGVVFALLAAAAVVIATKPTRLGLDLRGGIELVYEARPSPKVPKVTAQAVNDALDTIRKRTDALGVSEPEIQRAGKNQISIGLPAVKNAQRAVDQVGTTAQLQFYDWEPNVLGPRGPDTPYTGTKALYDAVKLASTQKPKAEATDAPPGGRQGHSLKYWDQRNDTEGNEYYLFGPNQLLRKGPDTSCRELLADFNPRAGPAKKYVKGTKCATELKKLGAGGPLAGSVVIEVPQGIRVVEAEKAKNQPASIHRLFVIEDDSELSGDQVKNPKQDFKNGSEPIVTFDFTDSGRKAFARVTKRIAQRGSKIILPPGTPVDAALQRFGITLDNQIVSLATIDFREFPEGLDGRGGASIEGIGDINQAQDLAQSLRIGALPVQLKLISQTQVSASLGQQALHQGLLAGAAGLLLTILFLLLFYRVLGVVATGALLIYSVLLFALVKLIPITLTLPGIAGLVLTLAVAADANIVMYERIKEEVRAGRSIPAGIAAGYSKALRTIVDANVVTIGVAFILFTLATAGVKGFAFTLGIGTLVSLFTAVLATSAILGSMARSRLLARPSALGVGNKERKGWTFDFMGNSRWFFSLSGLILVIGALAIAGKGINFGIDFESGTRITAPLQQNASVDQVRNVLSPLGYGDAKIQKVNDKALGTNVMQISTRTLQPPKVQQVQRVLEDRFGVRVGNFSANSIGPTFGKSIAQTALYAVIASLLLISLYIGFRFEFKFSVPVLIALAHDLLITAGVYALVGREVTTSTVAALLTILGYSLYDTVIVFDRIRENVPRMPRATFSQIANRAMSEVLTRSLATSFAVLMPVGSLLVFGGATLRDFAFALLVGVASGAYSSIFIATPVLMEWKEREPVYMRRRKLVMQDHDGVVPAFASVGLGEGSPRAARPRRERPAAAPQPAGAGATSATRSATAAPPRPRQAPAPRPAAAPTPPPDGDGDRQRRRPSRAGQPKQKQKPRGRKKHGRR